MKTMRRLKGLINECRQVILPYKIVAGFFVGSLIGLLIIFYDRAFAPYSDATWEFIKAPNTRLWFALAILSLGLCGAISLPLIEWIWFLRKSILRLSWKTLAAMLLWFSTIAIIVIVPLRTFFSYRCDYQHIFPHSWIKAMLLGLSIYLTLALAGIGTLSVSYAANGLSSPSPNDPAETLIKNYITLKENAFRLLVVFVLNITLYPLTIRAKLNAITPFCSPNSLLRMDMYNTGSKVFLAYGAFFSLLLMLTYLPAYISLHDAGGKLCDRLLPMPALQTSDWDIWYEKRQKVEVTLGINKNVTENVLTTVTLLVPFITGVYTFLTSK